MSGVDTEIGSTRRRATETPNQAGNMDTSYQGMNDGKDGLVSHSQSNFKEESHTRSLLKGVTWRCLATMTTVVIAWFVTGEVAQAFKIGFVEFFAKLAIYYLHERAWQKIHI